MDNGRWLDRSWDTSRVLSGASGAGRWSLVRPSHALSGPRPYQVGAEHEPVREALTLRCLYRFVTGRHKIDLPGARLAQWGQRPATGATLEDRIGNRMSNESHLYGVG